MNNEQIADQLSLLAKLMELHGENSFKAKGYASAAFTIDKLDKELSEMSEAELYQTRGIGQSLTEKIKELQQSGTMQALQELLQKTPTGVLEMMQIKGLGPKKIASIWKELEVENIGELEYACNENRLATLKGFGEKTQQSICRQIAFMRQSAGRHLWAQVEDYAQDTIQSLQGAFPKNRFQLTGSFRRQMETVDSIDIVTDLEANALEGAYRAAIQADCERKESTLEVRAESHPLLRFHLADKASFYKTLFRTSAAEEFLAAFPETADSPETEEIIFQKAGLPFVHPALRESSAILKQPVQPALIQPGDVKGIIHSHSKWSDGAETLETMARECMKKGYEYLVISDHSQSAFYANGLKPDRILAQHEEIDMLNKKLAPFRIFKSIESDILYDGQLDYEAEVLASFDLVIASVHSILKMTEEKAMNRLLTAIRNPYTTILGHMTGRLLLSREGYPVDHRAVIDACVEHKVVIEINANPRRLDMDWRWISYALDKGAMLSINPDAHYLHGYHDVYYGVMSAQKGGLTRERNLSSHSKDEFEKFLQTVRKS